MRSPIAAEKKRYTENRMTKEQHNLTEICGNRVISPTHSRYKKSYFPSFRRPKISSIRIFSVYKKRWYFLSQKSKEKIFLLYVFNAVGKTIFSTSENQRKDNLEVRLRGFRNLIFFIWKWKKKSNFLLRLTLFKEFLYFVSNILENIFLNNSSIFTEEDDKEIWLYFWQEILILSFVQKYKKSLN